jgi:hypothetical protein
MPQDVRHECQHRQATIEVQSPWEIGQPLTVYATLPSSENPQYAQPKVCMSFYRYIMISISLDGFIEGDSETNLGYKKATLIWHTNK